MELHASEIDIGTRTPTVVLNGADAAAFARENAPLRVGAPDEALLERF